MSGRTLGKSLERCQSSFLETVRILSSAFPTNGQIQRVRGETATNAADHTVAAKKTMIQIRGRPATWVRRFVRPTFSESVRFNGFKLVKKAID
jgi:esterase/lipase superfamily enzyme